MSGSIERAQWASSGWRQRRGGALAMVKITEDGYRVLLYWGRGSGGWRCHVTPPNGLDYFTLTPIAALADAEADGYRVVEELRKARAALLAATGAA